MKKNGSLKRALHVQYMIRKWDAVVNETEQKQLKYKTDWATMNAVRTTFFACFPFIQLSSAQVWCEYCHWLFPQKRPSSRNRPGFSIKLHTRNFSLTCSQWVYPNIFLWANTTQLFWVRSHCYHERCAARRLHDGGTNGFVVVARNHRRCVCDTLTRFSLTEISVERNSEIYLKWTARTNGRWFSN